MPKNGLSVLLGEQVLTAKVKVKESVTEALSSRKEFRLVIVAVKAYDTNELVKELRRLVIPAPILTLQNGVRNEEKLAFCNNHTAMVISGALATPVEVIQPGKVMIAKPNFILGLAPGPRANMVQLKNAGCVFKKAGFKVQYFWDWLDMKWSKLLLNMVANAQCAITGLTPANLFANPQLGRLEVLALKEAVKVTESLGRGPVWYGWFKYMVPVFVFLVKYAPVPWVQRLLAWKSTRARGNKRPSLCDDVLLPGPDEQSEVDYLNGEVVRSAAELAERPGRTLIQTPVNKAITDTLNNLVHGRVSVDDWHHFPHADRGQLMLEQVEAARRALHLSHR